MNPSYSRPGASGAFLLLLIALSVQSAFANNAGKIGKPVGPAMIKALKKASENGLSQTERAKDNALQAINGQSLASGGKPGILYMGADYCPYCASLRWPLVLALQRFGQFKHLAYMRSSRDDVYANTPTFTFHGASYHSKYLSFNAVELQNRAGKKLEHPTSNQVSLFRKFDAPPYTNQRGAIPFLYISGHYLQVGAPFNPKVLHGKSWQTISRKLDKPTSRLSQKVLGVTNLYTAALCQRTDHKPARVCSASGIKSAAAKLPQANGNQ